MPHIVNEEIASLLRTCVEHADKEDRATRERQIRHWRRLKLYWNNFSQVYWSETAHDYRLIDHTESDNSDQAYYDKPINVFKAFLETIIAALSIQVPAISCVPDDADNPLDLSTSKAGDKIAEQVYKHNDVMFLWLHALYIYCTEGLIACYSYPKTDEKYGTYEKSKYESEKLEAYVCPACGERVPDEIFTNKELNEFSPDEDDVDIKNIINKEGPICQECGTQLDPALQKSQLIIPRYVGVTTEVKTRVCLEVYGGLYIKVANYAKKQADTPYLLFSYEAHYTKALEKYPNIKDKIPHGGWSNSGVNDPYEQYGRLNTQYRGEFPIENVTIKNSWLRPEWFNIHTEEDYKRLKKLFPDGVRVTMVNDIVAEYENENLDDCWTLTQNPMSDFLNHEPLGELLTNIQDITNDLISLTLQTIEHGISQTWADPAVVNFNAQTQIEAMPGTITAAKSQGGTKGIADAFFSSKTAALAPEVLHLFRVVQELGQFVSGALPSLFGGQQARGASKTASEYAMSRAGAQQRLQTPWRMMTIWWKTVFGKVIPIYMKLLEGDERLVEKDDRGNFINVFIRRAELEGKIGSVELEASDNLPISDEQQKEMVLQLMEMNNQEIATALISPENLPTLRKVIKIPQFKLPGEDDRNKQYEEINALVNSEPIVLPPDEIAIQEAITTGQEPQPEELPSVEIDPLVDNHEVEAATCRSWLVSDAGRLAKIENPPGYKNVLLHMKAHMDVIREEMMAQAQALAEQGVAQEGQNNNSGSAKQKPKQPEKVNGESSARTPIE